MEEEVVAFLKRIGFTLFLVFTWMAVHSTVGIMHKLAFFDQFTWKNGAYYAFLVASTGGLAWFLHWLWKDHWHDFDDPNKP